jgi:hypothetical protein
MVPAHAHQLSHLTLPVERASPVSRLRPAAPRTYAPGPSSRIRRRARGHHGAPQPRVARPHCWFQVSVPAPPRACGRQRRMHPCRRPSALTAAPVVRRSAPRTRAPGLTSPAHPRRPSRCHSAPLTLPVGRASPACARGWPYHARPPSARSGPARVHFCIHGHHSAPAPTASPAHPQYLSPLAASHSHYLPSRFAHTAVERAPPLPR